MKKILITGAYGFIGRNLSAALLTVEDVEVFLFDKKNTEDDLKAFVNEADMIFHLAGVNRPKKVSEFSEGNTELTRQIVSYLEEAGKNVPVVFSSSIQAEWDNPYGQSKKDAEEVLMEYSKANKAPVLLYRFTNVFGKWSRPNYNSVVATFCHNLTHGEDIEINDARRELEFTYVDDIIEEFLEIMNMDTFSLSTYFYKIPITHKVLLGQLADILKSFAEERKSSLIPDMNNDLVRYLHATYLSYLEKDDFAYEADLKTDDRGWLFEFIKSENAGQIFVSQTKPGVTRGNHFHQTKVEKFCVVAGSGVIRLRNVLKEEIIEYAVDADTIKVVDIPPGYTHSIENNGDVDMITLFWVSQIFDADVPDTFYLNVDKTQDEQNNMSAAEEDTSDE